MKVTIKLLQSHVFPVLIILTPQVELALPLK